MSRWLSLSLMVMVAGWSWAESPRVLDGQRPNDARLGELKTLDDHFPFVVPANSAAWYARAEALRRRVLVATGLWPMPEKTPLQPVIFGKSERDGFTVEKVYFQSLPGHYVTGLLFRPSKPSAGRSAGVLCPHGHGGRMQAHSDEEIARQIAQGGEHFERSGRTPKLARCAQLARMGCVSFIFDMIGYADSVQISRQTAHRHAEPRPEELDRSGDWVFFSIDADLRNQSIMGLQTWNAIRALDFLASLPDVDPERLAVTGGSGGGTQTILLGAIDDRVKVAFPNGMVSTSMQGGCYCENCNLLRIDTGNVELAALFAPKPQAMTAADDWTRDMMTDGYPELRFLYAMIGEESDVYCRPMLEFKHNYNYIARATMYQWMNRHLALGLDDPVIEQDFEPLTESETTIWGEDHPAPTETGIAHERSVCRWWDDQSSAKLNSVTPTDAESLSKFRQVFGGGWRVVFDQGFPAEVVYNVKGKQQLGEISLTKGLLGDPARGAELPLLTLRGPKSDPKNLLIWSAESGKAAAFDDAGKPSALVVKLLDAGATVLLPDLLYQGEFIEDGNAIEQQRLIDDERSYSAFTFGYNRTLTAHRAADLMAVIAHAHQQPETQICLLGTTGSATWVAPAAAMAGPLLHRVVIESDGKRFADVNDYRDPNFVPGAVKYGDLPVLIALRSPHPTALVGESAPMEIVARAYDAAGAREAFKKIGSSDIDQTAIEWLLAPKGH